MGLPTPKFSFDMALRGFPMLLFHKDPPPPLPSVLFVAFFLTRPPIIGKILSVFLVKLTIHMHGYLFIYLFMASEKRKKKKKKKKLTSDCAANANENLQLLPKSHPIESGPPPPTIQSHSTTDHDSSNFYTR